MENDEWTGNSPSDCGLNANNVADGFAEPQPGLATSPSRLKHDGRPLGGLEFLPGQSSSHESLKSIL
jgi:hypothetical protein